jgi:hypothetical protein
MRPQDIKIDDPVFLTDGSDPIGAVRRVTLNNRAEIVIYVENAGDFVVPLAAVKDVHFGKVVLDVGALDAKLRQAIGHSHDAEDAEFNEHSEDAGPHTHRRPSTP